MKKVLLPLLFLTLFGCYSRDSKKLFVRVTNNGGWDASIIECDSASMQSITHVTLWIDGHKTEIYGKEISILSSSLY
jgi:hypothetical protein